MRNVGWTPGRYATKRKAGICLGVGNQCQDQASKTGSRLFLCLDSRPAEENKHPFEIIICGRRLLVRIDRPAVDVVEDGGVMPAPGIEMRRRTGLSAPQSGKECLATCQDVREFKKCIVQGNNVLSLLEIGKAGRA